MHLRVESHAQHVSRAHRDCDAIDLGEGLHPCAQAHHSRRANEEGRIADAGGAASICERQLPEAGLGLMPEVVARNGDIQATNQGLRRQLGPQCSQGVLITAGRHGRDRGERIAQHDKPGADAKHGLGARELPKRLQQVGQHQQPADGGGLAARNHQRVHVAQLLRSAHEGRDDSGLAKQRCEQLLVSALQRKHADVDGHGAGEAGGGGAAAGDRKAEVADSQQQKRGAKTKSNFGHGGWALPPARHGTRGQIAGYCNRAS